MSASPGALARLDELCIGNQSSTETSRAKIEMQGRDDKQCRSSVPVTDEGNEQDSICSTRTRSSRLLWPSRPTKSATHLRSTKQRDPKSQKAHKAQIIRLSPDINAKKMQPEEGLIACSGGSDDEGVGWFGASFIKRPGSKLKLGPEEWGKGLSARWPGPR